MELLLPNFIVDEVLESRMLKSETIVSKSFNHATVFQSDIVGFTKLCSTLSPSDICYFLHDLYQRYDSFSHLRKIEKIETIGFACIIFICILFFVFL